MSLLNTGTNRRDPGSVLFWLLASAFIGASALVHLAAGWTFPVPWPDEAVFLQQAIAVQQHNTLFTPFLSDARTILWMPPGYMIFMGMLFKVLGSAFSMARLISFVLTMLAFCGLLFMYRHSSLRFPVLVLVGLFFLGRHFVILGNVARMESLLLVGVTAAMVLFHARQSLAAMAVLISLPLIHPNGMYFILAGIVLLAVQTRSLREEWNAARWARVFILIVLTAIVVSIAYSLGHWNDLLSDMGYQFGRKARRNLFAPFLSSGNLAFCSLGAAALIGALWRKEQNAVIMILFAFAFWVINRVGQEMWYEVFDGCAILLLLLGLMELLNPRRRILTGTLLFLLALYAGRQLQWIEGLRNYPESLRWYSMRIRNTPPYFAASDREKIDALLQSHQNGGRPLRTLIYPSADALFFQELEGRSLRSMYVARDTSLFPTRDHDLYLVHVSRFMPLGWEWSFLPWVFEDAGIDTSDRRRVLIEREGTEVWYYNFVHDPMQTDSLKPADAHR
ncbi:MAG TPA: hypothetical protein VMH23_06030 [Bacteroidota bacterium]|nr:hypothetical protein [Bacteroidota bacterium]